MDISPSQILEIMPHSTGELAERYAPALSHAMAKFRINTPLRAAAFIAQVAHESAQLTTTVESTFYSSAERLKKLFPGVFASAAEAATYVKDPIRCANRIYAGKNGNGDEMSEDGWLYRGRGLIQLTGRGNYKECGLGIGIDLVSDPDLLLEPGNGAKSAAWFWNTKGCNELADVAMFGAITKRINGGYNGAQERLAFYAAAKKALGI